ncbi:MAG: hypothetical protein RL701_7564, partial [Pseudomonadota bacterium]
QPLETALMQGVRDEQVSYIRGGMRAGSQASVGGAYAGVTTVAEATEIATGVRIPAGWNEQLPPIRINVEPGLFELQDGRHRLEAARNAGATHIRANLHFPDGTVVERIIPIPAI